jgi:tetratricopeptide (TPR) repeat protein
VATRLNNLGQLLFKTGRTAEAEPLLRQGLKINQSAFGSKHPSVANSLNNLARLLQFTGRHEEAEQTFRQSLEIDEEIFGANHPNVAIGCNNIGMLLRDIGRISEAAIFLRRAAISLIQASQSTGHEHPHLQHVVDNYCQLLAATGLCHSQIHARIAELQGAATQQSIASIVRNELPANVSGDQI